MRLIVPARTCRSELHTARPQNSSVFGTPIRIGGYRWTSVRAKGGKASDKPNLRLAQPNKRKKVRIMRKLLVTTTALAMTLFVGVDMARADSTTTPAVTVTGTADVANKMIGRNVFNSAGEKVGEVESALIDQDGKVRYVIVGVGGFLGLGERDVALRWDQLTMADNDQKIVVNMTKEQLTALPAHRFADASSKGKVYAYDEDLKTNAYLSNDAGTAMAPSSAVDTKKLIGRNIKNPAGDTVGEIESVLVDQAGNVKYVVVGVGGFLGIGEKHIALSWDSLTISDNGEKVTADVTKDSLKGLPDYRYTDPASRGTVSSYDDTLKDNPYLADSSTATPPLPGANSFTESQARERIEAKGFTSVTGLKKDDQSIWRGTAMKDGQTVNVALDYKGNVVAQ
jgi:sporulation protein YlmC with PRC-barrel domain